MSKINLLIFLISMLGSIAGKAQDSLDIMIGQMIVVGFDDLNEIEFKDSLRERIKEQKLGGIIFYEKNLSPFNTKADLGKTIAYYQKKSSIPLFMSIDEEGGVVNRLKPVYGFKETVTAQYLGNLDNVDSTRYYSAIIAKQLHELGFNLNFAPVVDLNINPDGPAIGRHGRSFSREFTTVADHARVFVEHHDSFGIGTVLKHFPGHGSADKNTHYEITDVSSTWLIEELYPYKILIDSGKAKAIMTAHIVNRTTDETKLPATLSKKTITDLLRNYLGYQGVVFSDDMQMSAVGEYYGLEESITLAINAGVDVLLFCNNVHADKRVSVDQVHSTIKNLVLEGKISQARIVESYDRVLDLKESLGMLNPNYRRALLKRLKELN